MRRPLYASTFREETGELVNLTPLLDVLFVVLILFILLTPFFQIDEIDLTPKKVTEQSHTPIKEKRPLKIAIKKDGSYLINNQFVSRQDLEPLLRKIQTANPKEVPEIYPDSLAPFVSYQTIKTLLEEIGYEQLDVVLKNQAP
ncbi:MAG: hypothetical protein S4CHLAM102_08430 [Chlamydiia bacterium]|nr:hypothetical protein [Chlamydiia bacterium]